MRMKLPSPGVLSHVGSPAAGLAEIEFMAAAGEPRPIRRIRRAYCPTFPIT
jgi:hypothetical protein